MSYNLDENQPVHDNPSCNWRAMNAGDSGEVNVRAGDNGMPCEVVDSRRDEGTSFKTEEWASSFRCQGFARRVYKGESIDVHTCVDRGTKAVT